MAEKKSGVSKTAKRSMMDDKKLAIPKVMAWAWERGFKVGQGRKPDAYIFNTADLSLFDPNDFIIIHSNSQWVGSAGTQGARK